MEPLTGEIIDINNEYGSYQEYKAAVSAEMQRSAESFVRIGYLLKVARDTDILSGSGYGCVNEFACAEYGLDKSQVSRFIRINDKYSEGGYSDRLQEKYRNFGYAKLALMLTLPAAVSEELTTAYTKSEIRAIKGEIDAEKERTDIEVMLEEKTAGQQEYGCLAEVLRQLCHDAPQLYLKLYESVMDTLYDGTSMPVITKMWEVLAPAEEAVHSVRIAGVGKKMLFIKGTNKDVVLLDVRSEGKETYSWDDLITAMETLCIEDDPKENWKILYEEIFPEEKEPVAPVQPAEKAKKPQRVYVPEPQIPEKTEKSNEQTREEERHVDMEAEVPDGTAGAQAGIDENAIEHADNADGTGGTDGAGVTDVEDGAEVKERMSAPGSVSKPLTEDGGTEMQVADEPDAAEGQMDIWQHPQWTPPTWTRPVIKGQNLRKGYIKALQDLLEKIYNLTVEGDYETAEGQVDAVRGTIHKIKDIDGQETG